MGFFNPVTAEAASSIVVGTTIVTGGTASGILWNNAGVLAAGAATLAGGTALAGVTSVAINGATIGTNALAATGTANISGTVTFGGNMVFAGTITGNWSGALAGLGLNNGAGRLISMSSIGNIGFASTDTGNAASNDSNFSRVSAGVIGVGTGTQGSTAAGMSMTTLLSTTIQTGAPAGASAGLWKIGSLVTGAVVLDTTRSIFVDIGGTVYKLMIAQ